MGFNNLFEPASALTEVLRAGTMEGSAPLFADVEREYNKTVEALRALD